MNDIDRFAHEVHELAKAKGWYGLPRRPLEFHALIHTEVSEASEALREGTEYEYDDNGKPEGEMAELADTVIRVLDYMRHRGYNPSRLLADKHRYNQGRSFRHGGKRK